MKPRIITTERARKLIGKGGNVFVVTYLDYEGIERCRVARIWKIDCRDGVCYLRCDDTWLVLSTVRSIRLWREPTAFPLGRTNGETP
jgi:hypothetical protein